MVARTGLVGLDVIRAQNLSVFFKDVGLSWTIYPKLQGLLPGDVPRVRIRFTGHSDFLEDWPNLIEVFSCGLSNIHGPGCVQDAAPIRADVLMRSHNGSTQRSLLNCSTDRPASRAIPPFVNAFTGLCLGTVRIRMSSDITICFPDGGFENLPSLT